MLFFVLLFNFQWGKQKQVFFHFIKVLKKSLFSIFGFWKPQESSQGPSSSIFFLLYQPCGLSWPMRWIPCYCWHGWHQVLNQKPPRQLLYALHLLHLDTSTCHQTTGFSLIPLPTDMSNELHSPSDLKSRFTSNTTFSFDSCKWDISSSSSPTPLCPSNTFKNSRG